MNLFGLKVERGGWYAGIWYSQKRLDALREKLLDQAEETALCDGDFIYAQCGGCKHFAAYDGDYGICLEEQSPNFGRVVFEHSGCKFHSHWKDNDYFGDGVNGQSKRDDPK